MKTWPIALAVVIGALILSGCQKNPEPIISGCAIQISYDQDVYPSSLWPKPSGGVTTTVHVVMCKKAMPK